MKQRPTDFHSGACRSSWVRAVGCQLLAHAVLQHPVALSHVFGAAGLLTVSAGLKRSQSGGQSGLHPGGHVGSKQQSNPASKSQFGGQSTSQPGGQVGSSQQSNDAVAVPVSALATASHPAQPPNTASGNAATKPQINFRPVILLLLFRENYAGCAERSNESSNRHNPLSNTFRTHGSSTR